jgi:hypothetical protein
MDHFEPFWKKPSRDEARRRVKEWKERLVGVVERFKDAEGRRPVHTFFYPEEEYDPDCLNSLSELQQKGVGDVEIHLHHDNDTRQGLEKKLIGFKTTLYKDHGFLRKDNRTGDIMYGFIHGNWALDNSREDGRCCGVNNELLILKETGCYADFTLPSAPSDTQTRKINSIYYAFDDPSKPKSHDSGLDVLVGGKQLGDLMIVQGPLALNWKRRKWGILPKIENGEIGFNNPPSSERVDLWVNQRIHVKGRPEWLFVKVYTHGCQDGNKALLLNGGLEKLYTFLQDRYNDSVNYVLHYVSAWEMYNIIKAAEAGLEGNPGDYRNYTMDI